MADLKEKTNASPSADDANNPGQQLYDKEFNNIAANYGKTADSSAEDKNIDKLRNAEKQPAQPDKQALDQTAAGKAAIAAASTVGTPVVGAAAKLLGKIKTKQGGIVSGVVGVIVVILLAVAALSPTALLLSLKDTGLKWSTHFSNVAGSKRLGAVLEKRFFTDPASCKGAKILCKFSAGMSDEELNNMKRNGLIADSDISESGGKKFLKRMTFSSNGKTTVVSKSSFASHFSSTIDFRSKISNVIDSRGIITRSPAALKKFSLLGIDRRAPLGEGGDEKTRLQKFRELMYGKKTTVNLAPDTANTGQVDQATQTKINGIEGMDELQAQADAVSKDAVTKGPIALAPDTNALIEPDYAKLTLNGAKGTLKSSLMGFFAAADSACSIFNTLRILNFAAKAYASLALIKYAGLFMTIADKQKSSEVSAAEVATAAGILVKPSVEPSSRGKDFSTSQGYNLMYYGKVTRPEDLARFSIGTTAMQALNSVYETFKFGNLSTEFCRNVKSWWGQLSLGVLGVLTGVFTLGTGFIVGAGVGAATALAFSYIVQVMTMKLVPIIAGTVAPDAATDPEGGYGAGNAIAAGLGAFGSELGKAGGYRPLSDTMANTVAASDEAKMVAAVDKANEAAKNPFSLDNPTSIPNQLAIAMSPLVSRPSSLTYYMTTFGSMLRSSLAAPITPIAKAETYTLDSYGGKYCSEKTDTNIVDDAQIRGLARDANCNMIYGAAPNTLGNVNDDSDPFSIQSTMNYMITNDWVDPDTGEPTSDAAGSYGKWLESCVDSTDPIVDAYSADLEGSEDPSMCYLEDVKLDYFRTYRQYTTSQTGVEAAANNKLGYADPSTAAGLPAAEDPNATPQTASAGGMVWPVRKANWPARPSPILNCSLLYESGGGAAGTVHTGIDIMVPTGTPLYAAADGVVSMSTSSYGAMNIQTNLKDSKGNTIYLNYQHMSRKVVGLNDPVKKDQLIGYSGSTGTTNSHLHFGVWITNGFLSGHSDPFSPAGARTLSKMLHPMTYMPEDGRNVNKCSKPYAVP